jgi:hypothetical protein
MTRSTIESDAIMADHHPRVERDVRAVRRAHARQDGAVAVEFALIFPILIVLVLGIIEFGFGYHAWDSTQNAAREGARLAAVDPDLGAIEARVRGTTNSLDQSRLHVTVTCSPGGSSFGSCGDPSGWPEGLIVRVEVDYDYRFITPLPGLIGVGREKTMTSTAEARFEGQ